MTLRGKAKWSGNTSPTACMGAYMPFKTAPSISTKAGQSSSVHRTYGPSPLSHKLSPLEAPRCYERYSAGETIIKGSLVNETSVLRTFKNCSYTAHHTPLIIHHSSYTTYHTPLIIHHSSYTTHRHHSPYATHRHHSSYTTHHTPLIRHHSSYTTHHTPLIIHHSSSSWL